MTSDVRTLLKKQNKGRAAERHQGCKRNLTNNNLRLVWHGLQSITNYRGSIPITTSSDTSLAEELNNIFSCFGAKSPDTAELSPQSTSNTSLILQEHQVRQGLKPVNNR